jgi:hypothetical protein
MSFDLKDNGEHRQFDSGAKRDRPKGKGRFDLLFMHVQTRLSCILEKGAEKYAAWNWSKGMPLSVYMDSAMRHLNQFREGYTDEDHLGQAIWNLCALCETQEWIARGLLPKELDDLPNFMPKGEFENIGEGRLRPVEKDPVEKDPIEKDPERVPPTKIEMWKLAIRSGHLFSVDDRDWAAFEKFCLAERWEPRYVYNPLSGQYHIRHVKHTL